MNEGAELSSSQVLILDDKNFDEHIKASDLPVLVDFWAEWCGPCKMIAPIVEELAQEKKGSLRVAKLNVDENMETTRRYGIMSIPTLILFKAGEPVERIVGAIPRSSLLARLEPHLGHSSQ